MVTLPAGKYYVGNPCYHINNEKWSDYCDQVVFAQDKKTVFNGKNTCCFNTAYGDGCYQDQFGNNYGVDAGLIGVVELDSDYPLSLIDKK